MRTVVIGVGNPTLTDDGVGIRAAGQLAERLGELGASAAEADVTSVCAGGLRLMEAMAGYDRAIVLDALAVGELPAGTTVELDRGDLDMTHNLASVHDMSLPYALDLGTAAGVDLPHEIRVFGVRAADVTTFSEALSPPVAAAVPVLVERVLSVLRNGDAPPATVGGATPERTER